MLNARSLRRFGEAQVEDQETIAWVLSRMQTELSDYMQQGPDEPGPAEVHALAERKVQTYINSLLRELTAIRQ